MIAPGVVKAFEASAEYQPVTIAGECVDIGGCLNTLTPSRSQIRGTSSMSPNSCLVEVVAWPHLWQVSAGASLTDSLKQHAESGALDPSAR
jgi:hypothetical protein